MTDKSKTYIINLLILLTYSIFGISILVTSEGMWGINHLNFLPAIYSYLYGIIFCLILYLITFRRPEYFLDNVIEKVNQCLWMNGSLWRFIISGIATVFFIAFPVRVHLLGDGYTWLANLGSGELYIHKWTEPGSLYLIRKLQSIFGSYSRETALMSFRILSYISGFTYIYNIIGIAGKIAGQSQTRLISLSTFLFSGSILLFFGYVEFYPLLWALLAITVNLSLMYLEKRRYLLWVWVAYLASVLAHLQALYFLPGILYLTIQNIKHISIKKLSYAVILIGSLAAIIIFSQLQGTRVDLEVLMLPLFEGRPPAPDYAVFSLPHLLNILNLLMAVLPGILILIGLWLLYGRKKINDTVSVYFLILSAGSLIFLLFFGAGITMGRDWDIMALSFFAPALLILYKLDKGEMKISNKAVTAYMLVITFATIAYLAACTGVSSAEDRFYTLLNDRHENSWAIYANYFHRINDIERFNEIMTEKNRRFPETKLVEQAYKQIESGNYRRAMSLARRMVEKNPYNAGYLQVLGNVFGKIENYDSAEYYYRRGATLEPYNAGLLNELGQLYMKQGKYDSATAIFKKARTFSGKSFLMEGLGLAYIHKREYDSAGAVADQLFEEYENSPGGHLLMLTIHLNKGNLDSAAKHYREYLEHGRERSDYQSLKEHFRYLKDY